MILEYLLFYGLLAGIILALLLGVVVAYGFAFTKSQYVAYLYIGVFVTFTASTHGLLDATRVIYGRGSGQIIFPFVTWALWGTAVAALLTQMLHRKELPEYPLGILLLAAASAAHALKPTHLMADERSAFDLQMVPHAFGEWHEDPQSSAQIIDLQQEAFIKVIYKQTLSRTYVNTTGDRIMLSLAYVEQQSDSFGVHLRETCYQAQGFQIGELFTAQIKTSSTSMLVNRFVATMGRRVEPITYWVPVGDQAGAGSTQRKLAQLRIALHGEIPDDTLVRVSTIGIDTHGAYEVQARFVNDLETALPKNLRALLFGSISQS
jgi:EpsI family protein